MASIQMVNRLDERRGLLLARRLVEDGADVTAICWWADVEEEEPHLLVGFPHYREEGPRITISRLSDSFVKLPMADAPDFLRTEAVPSDDARLQALIMHPWTTVPVENADLGYRLVNVWSRSRGVAQALVYFLKEEDKVLVPLPPPVPQAT